MQTGLFFMENRVDISKILKTDLSYNLKNAFLSTYPKNTKTPDALLKKARIWKRLYPIIKGYINIFCKQTQCNTT